MGWWEVLLGIDRAAVDTKRRVKRTVRAVDPLSAGAVAEYLTDKKLDDPVEYSHAIRVRQLHTYKPAALAMAA